MGTESARGTFVPARGVELPEMFPQDYPCRLLPILHNPDHRGKGQKSRQMFQHEFLVVTSLFLNLANDKSPRGEPATGWTISMVPQAGLLTHLLLLLHCQAQQPSLRPCP